MWNLTRIDMELRKSFADRFSGDFKVFYDKNEITDDFFKSVSKENFMLLVNTPEKFYEKFKNYTGKKQIHFLDKIKLLIKKRGIKPLFFLSLLKYSVTDNFVAYNLAVG